jgi:N-acetylneuraminic acid mutarotase
MSEIAISRRTVLGSAVSAALLPTFASGSAAAMGAAYRAGAPALDPSGGKPRYLHSATALQDGRILVAGGYHVNEALRTQNRVLPSNSVQIYDPGSDSWFDAAPMKTARARHASVLLSDGRVAVLGGVLTSVLASVEIYDPSTDAWTRGAPLPRPMADHCACASGSKIVLSGGELGTSALIHSVAATYSQRIP